MWTTVFIALSVASSLAGTESGNADSRAVLEVERMGGYVEFGLPDGRWSGADETSRVVLMHWPHPDRSARVVSVRVDEFSFARAVARNIDRRIPEHVDPSILGAIGEFQNLEELSFACSRPMRGTLGKIAGLKKLRVLRLDCAVTSEDIWKISGLENIERLDIDHSRLGEQDVVRILEAFPKLHELHVSSERFSRSAQRFEAVLSQRHPGKRIRLYDGLPRAFPIGGHSGDTRR